MLYRPIKFLATWFGILAFLANATVLGSGWVLCAEPDGQLAVEFKGDFNTCLTAPMSTCINQELDCEEIADSHEQCGCETIPCKDTPLGTELAPLQKKIQLVSFCDENPSPELSIAYIPSHLYSDNIRFVALNYNAHPFYCAQLLSLRKDILLI